MIFSTISKNTLCFSQRGCSGLAENCPSEFSPPEFCPPEYCPPEFCPPGKFLKNMRFLIFLKNLNFFFWKYFFTLFEVYSDFKLKKIVNNLDIGRRIKLRLTGVRNGGDQRHWYKQSARELSGFSNIVIPQPRSQPTLGWGCWEKFSSRGPRILIQKLPQFFPIGLSCSQKAFPSRNKIQRQYLSRIYF